MSRKRTKQYLMLLMVVGLVSIAAGGSGTFASFDAEVANTGNYFATGTLILNDNGGVNTCTSAVDTGNHNTTGTDCDTLFATPKIQEPRAVLTTALATSPNTISLAFTGGLTGAAIASGDTLTVTDPTGTHTDTFTATQAVLAGVGASSQSVTVTSKAANFAYPTGSVVRDSNATYYANLTLTNAGTIDASGISFKSSGANGCTDQAYEPSGTLSSQLTAGTSYTQIPVASVSGGVEDGYADGDSLVVSTAGHSQTFIVDGAQIASTISSQGYVLVHADSANFTYPAASSVAGPSFTTVATGLCGNVKMSIQETDSLHTTPVANCAYPAVSGTACALASGTVLSSLPTTETPLTLSDPSFTAGSARYFQIALTTPVASLTNGDQNKATQKFGLTWHIDQA